jgi:hypothetical protein
MSKTAFTIGDVSNARRTFLLSAGAVLATGLLRAELLGQKAEQPSNDVPPFVRRGLPGPFQAALKPLEGEWRVDKQIFIAIGTRERPATGVGVTCHRRWFGGGRHLEDITEGTIGGSPYYRLGVLGFSNVDRRYELATFDALNANMMVYVSDPLDQPSSKTTLSGTFRDQGLLGEAYAGKSIPMRTTIEILGPDRHIVDLTFLPPGEPEVLIDHSVYVRA